MRFPQWHLHTSFEGIVRGDPPSLEVLPQSQRGTLSNIPDSVTVGGSGSCRCCIRHECYKKREKKTK